MSFSDFTFPEVQTALGVSLDESDLFARIPPSPVRMDFLSTLAEGANLALAINTEKAKSEFIIAPLLFELRRSLGGSFGLFSGVELNADASRGLNGVCDFILTRGSRQFVLSTPLIAIVESKNDNLRTGLGQCIASMVAARLVNQRSPNPVDVVFGVVTTGSAWKFLRLEEETITLDVPEYYVDNPGKIFGIFNHILS